MVLSKKVFSEKSCSKNWTFSWEKKKSHPEITWNLGWYNMNMKC